MSNRFDEVNDFLKALASETRQRILLDAFGNGEERTVNQVAAIAGLGQSTASEHLAMLKRAGILRSRRVGKEVYYRPNGPHILASLHRLTEIVASCCPDD